MILLRSHRFGERESELLARFAAVDGHRTLLALDETRGPIDTGDAPKLPITRSAAEALGLYCPADVAWRNGDYALYLARKRFPDERFFWMVEPDIEHSFPSDRALFGFFDGATDADLLAPHLHMPTDRWWWSQTVRSSGGRVRRALFCFVRVSAPALDHCLAVRRRASFSLRDRLLWPNDEAFVASELDRARFRLSDLNDFGREIYTTGTLSFDDPLDGDRLDLDRGDCLLYHPVLRGDALRERVARIRDNEDRGYPFKRIRRRVQRLLG